MSYDTPSAAWTFPPSRVNESRSRQAKHIDRDGLHAPHGIIRDTHPILHIRRKHFACLSDRRTKHQPTDLLIDVWRKMSLRCLAHISWLLVTRSLTGTVKEVNHSIEAFYRKSLGSLFVWSVPSESSNPNVSPDEGTNFQLLGPVQLLATNPSMSQTHPRHPPRWYGWPLLSSA